jgi:outer membrane protein assembly factor BamA
MDADLRRLEAYYRSRGYAAAVLGEPVVRVGKRQTGRWDLWGRMRGFRQSLSIEIPVVEGPKFRLRSVGSKGNAKRAAKAVADIIGAIKVPSTYDSTRLARVREKILGALGQAGYGLAGVLLEQSTDWAERSVDAMYVIDAGQPVLVRRIRFAGNTIIPEKFLRRELTIQEGEVFDALRLDESVDRLNRSGLVEEMSRSDVLLQPGGDPGTLDILLKIREPARQGLFLTGGDRDLGGPYLGILYSAFDLLGVGDRLAVELDGGAGQSNFLLDLVVRRLLGTPFTLALSGFYRMTNVRIAGLVPDLEDVAGLFSSGSRGAGLSGTYPLSRHAKAGIGASLRRSHSGTEHQYSTSLTAVEIAPVFHFDSTMGRGPRKRGQSLFLRHGWVGTPMPFQPRSSTNRFQYSRHVDDPWSSGRNSLAFRFQGALVRTKRGSALPLAERFFPGAETARGFTAGGLTPRAGTPAAASPAGADSVLGFSAEYRIPLAKACSSAAFVDIGWSRLGSERASELGQGSKLVAATNRLLRASIGGELRLPLPILHQSGRLIFSWNPMRLDRVVQKSADPIRLADPKTSLRFTLGGIF